MKKTFAFFLMALPTLVLASCGEGGPTEISSSMDPVGASSSAAATGNTLSSVLGSFGKNVTVKSIYQFIDTGDDKTLASITAKYVEEGCLFDYANFPNQTVSTGFVSKDDKTHSFTIPDGQEELVLGSEVLNASGASVSSFRDIYYDPSYVGEHVEDYCAENVFIPKIAGKTNGYFYLYDKVYESDLPSVSEETSTEEGEEGEGTSEDVIESSEDSGKLLQDNTARLVNLAKAIGVYEAATSFGTMDIHSAELYFSAKGTTFNITFYFSYRDGYDRFAVKTTINNIGKTKVAPLDAYLGA